ncbi:MAG TPA: SCO family protein [Steroidobacteraceae bacterium]|nr:SCO family protein [Steroidobacteraceae bacterium]
MTRRSVLWFACFGLAAVIAGALLARMMQQSAVPLASGTWLPQARPLEAFQLTDLDGEPFTTARLTGHPTLLFFGFTHCPDVCPTTLAALAQVQKAGPLPRSQVVFVSIDPDRDSAALLKAYLDAFDPQFIGVRGPTAALAPLLRSLSAIAVRQDLPGGDYTMDHSATLYLLDTRARLVAVFSPPFTVAALSADLRRVGSAAAL